VEKSETSEKGKSMAKTRNLKRLKARKPPGTVLTMAGSVKWEGVLNHPQGHETGGKKIG